MGWLVAAAVALSIAAGLCASAEVAIIRASRASTREAGRGASPEPARLRAVLAEPSRYLSVMMLARACGQVTAVVLVTAALVHWLHGSWHAYLIAAAAMTVIMFVLGGIWPRTLGRHFDRQLAVAAARVFYPVVRVLGPVPRLLLAGGRALTPGRESRDSAASEEELRGLVDLLEERRVIEPRERAMIHSVFELGDTIVREVMVPRTDIVFVERDKTVRQALSLALRSGFSRIPVVGENKDDVIGIAYLKDLVARSREHPEA
jgi:CBS domain containing-hemolysin-like protein